MSRRDLPTAGAFVKSPIHENISSRETLQTERDEREREGAEITRMFLLAGEIRR